MDTAATTTTVDHVDPLFSGTEQPALAGFLAGYSGLTRDATGSSSLPTSCLQKRAASCHLALDLSAHPLSVIRVQTARRASGARAGPAILKLMPTVRGRRSLRTFVMLFAVPVVASALIAWWLIGDVSERGGYLQILPLPLSETTAAAAGAIGAVFALVFL